MALTREDVELGVGEHILATLLDVWDASADPVAPSVYRAKP